MHFAKSRHLDLGYNVLETFKKNTMDGADKMLEIILRGNGILELQSHAFACCPKLSTVDLSHNHLRTIHKDTFSDQVRKKTFSRT
ncbi:leucine Rich repeat-containing domain protein [Cooperia oncophora]